MALIELKNVCKSYYSGSLETKAVCSANLKIKSGEFIAIMGPSGSGKSTLMNIMGFLDVPTRGRYYFENKKVTSFDEDSLAEIRNKKVGFVFQFFYLLPRMTALDNVKIPMIYADVKDKEQDKRARKALKQVGLGHRMKNRPNELSGGEQQRVAIARALTNNPKIIFADEPTGNLDSVSAKEIMKIFEKLNKEGKTIILVTHDSKTASYAKRKIRLKDGLIQ
ncbi:ATP-binding cassette domain-containing protein [Candidatus Peregrinibacteria bacterium]|nr:ATP-binding cassette domain-containing protein [Candidatus Peregrinibacteria bacterium]